MSLVEAMIHRPATLPPLSRMVLRAAVVIATWETRHTTRKSLRNLDNHLLRDVGLDPMTASTEAERPFWRD